MAGKGFPPKDPDRRKRSNGSSAVVLGSDGVERGPAIPRAPKGAPWPEATKRWWVNWRRSAQAQIFTATDWDYLADTALLHAALHRGDTSVAAELRLRVAKFGATPEDRQRLRVNIRDDPGEGGSKAGPRKRGKAPALRVVDPQAS